MNLEVYRNYVAIIDASTISAASRELHIAQPALSNQLKALEAAYGTQLVERGPRHITPNNAGKILYEKARRMCQLEDAAQKEINASILGTKGTLHLGITPTWPDTNSANMILDFSNTYPEIDFDIYEENSGQLLELLEKGTIEVAVIRSAGQLPPSFSVRHTIDERLMVAFHKKSPWLSSHLDAVPLTALEDVPLAISRGFWQKILEICQNAGFTPHIRAVCSSRYMPLRWASSGTVAAIFVGPVRPDQLSQDICCIPLLGPGLETRRLFAISKSRSLSAVAEAFLNYIHDRSSDQYLTNKGKK